MKTAAWFHSQARQFFKLHYESRRAYLESWQDWKQVRGESTTEKVLFSNEPRAKELIADEQMYGRFALLYATMATMEMMHEAREGESPREEQ